MRLDLLGLSGPYSGILVPSCFLLGFCGPTAMFTGCLPLVANSINGLVETGVTGCWVLFQARNPHRFHTEGEVVPNGDAISVLLEILVRLRSSYQNT